MNRNPIITCAVTGAGDTAGRHPDLPITPEQIATAALEAAEAGAAIVHIHVRDPATGKGSRDVELYRRALELVRVANTDVIINTTAGMGGDLLIGDPDPFDFQPEGTDLVNGLERLAHVEALKPDMCSIDCGTLNFGEGHQVYVSTPNMVRDMAKRVRELGVKPELEIFDTGHLWLANTLVDEGLVDDPSWIQLCTGIPYGMPNDVGLLAALTRLLARRRRVHHLRAVGAADAMGCPGGPARRPRQGGLGGQPLPGSRGVRLERRPGAPGARGGGGDGGQDSDFGSGA